MTTLLADREGRGDGCFGQVSMTWNETSSHIKEEIYSIWWHSTHVPFTRQRNPSGRRPLKQTLLRSHLWMGWGPRGIFLLFALQNSFVEVWVCWAHHCEGKVSLGLCDAQLCEDSFEASFPPPQCVSPEKDGHWNIFACTKDMTTQKQIWNKPIVHLHAHASEVIEISILGLSNLSQCRSSSKHLLSGLSYGLSKFWAYAYGLRHLHTRSRQQIEPQSEES